MPLGFHFGATSLRDRTGRRARFSRRWLGGAALGLVPWIAPPAGPLRATLRAEARTRTFRLAASGRVYRLHLPIGAERGMMDTPRPLVLAFHGAGATATRQERATRLSEVADRAGFVVAYPEGRARRWVGDAADSAFVREVVADVAQRTSIDARRVYATGVSNGGMMAERAGCGMADLFAAIATVAGVYGPTATCRPARPLPVLALHGLGDQRAPYAGRIAAPQRLSVLTWASGWAARNACAPAPTITRSPGVATRAWRGCAGGAAVVLQTLTALGHGWPGDASDPAVSPSPVDASDEIWAFFAAHPRPSTVAVAR